MGRRLDNRTLNRCKRKAHYWAAPLVYGGVNAGHPAVIRDPALSGGCLDGGGASASLHRGMYLFESDTWGWFLVSGPWFMLDCGTWRRVNLWPRKSNWIYINIEFVPRRWRRMACEFFKQWHSNAPIIIMVMLREGAAGSTNIMMWPLMWFTRHKSWIFLLHLHSS